MDLDDAVTGYPAGVKAIGGGHVLNVGDDEVGETRIAAFCPAVVYVWCCSSRDSFLCQFTLQEARERRAVILKAVRDHAQIDAYLPQMEATIVKYMRRWQVRQRVRRTAGPDVMQAVQSRRCCANFHDRFAAVTHHTRPCRT